MAAGDKTEIQVEWSSANSVSVSASGNQTSDEFNPSTGAIDGRIQLKADNSGTPASGDTIDFYLLEALGDPDGASTDEFVTTGHPLFLGRIDTNTEDPGIIVVQLPMPFKGAKVYAENNASSNAITVSACAYFVEAV
jgi:hypothetical protein